MPEQARAIVHLDLDAFFAAVEMLENPELKGKPVIVGGRPESRGVVSSASYPARALGVRSAMPTARALTLCPEAILLPPRHSLYRSYSRKVMTLLRDACSIVEQMSIDEAYLDLTNQLALWAEAPEVARQLQHKVHEEVGLSASLGVATNKLVAKVASDQDKPRGLTVVPPGAEASFLGPLPVRVLWGIGPVTAQKLAEMGVSTVGELALVDKQELLTRFGTQGATMALQAQGIDDRPVITDHELKSASQEQTFGRDLADQEILEEHLRRLSEGVAERLKRADLAAATVVVKLRYADFTTLTRQMTLAVPTNDHEEIHQAALILFQRTWKKGRPLRLLGVAGRQLSPPVGQLSFW